MNKNKLKIAYHDERHMASSYYTSLRFASDYAKNKNLYVLITAMQHAKFILNFEHYQLSLNRLTNLNGAHKRRNLHGRIRNERVRIAQEKIQR